VEVYTAGVVAAPALTATVLFTIRQVAAEAAITQRMRSGTLLSFLVGECPPDQTER
jgi:hypothetical protein